MLTEKCLFSRCPVQFFFFVKHFIFVYGHGHIHLLRVFQLLSCLFFVKVFFQIFFLKFQLFKFKKNTVSFFYISVKQIKLLMKQNRYVIHMSIFWLWSNFFVFNLKKNIHKSLIIHLMPLKYHHVLFT